MRMNIQNHLYGSQEYWNIPKPEAPFSGCLLVSDMFYIPMDQHDYKQSKRNIND
jgi:hypothetical protein